MHVETKNQGSAYALVHIVVEKNHLSRASRFSVEVVDDAVEFDAGMAEMDAPNAPDAAAAGDDASYNWVDELHWMHL